MARTYLSLRAGFPEVFIGGSLWKTPHLNQAGFSIVEVLIATGIGIVGALAISHLALNTLQMNKHAEIIGLLAGFSQKARF